MVMEQPKDLYFKLCPTVHFSLRHVYGFDVEGTENIPEEPALFAANHLKMVDSLMMAVAYTEHTGKAMRFGAKKEYFSGRGFSKSHSENDGGLRFRWPHEIAMSRAAKWLVDGTRQVPVVRENGTREDLDIFFKSIHATLERGDSFGLHPEGTRSHDGRLYKFRYGIAHAAFREMVPVVPVGIIYPPKKIDHEHIFEEYGRKVIFGEPVLPQDFERTPKRADALSDELEGRVAAITGQERAGELAQIYKKRDS